MSLRHCIAICGESILLLLISEGRGVRPGGRSRRFELHLPDIVARIVSIAPDVVILERGGDDGGLTRELLSHGLLLVELNANQSTVTLLTGHEVSVSGAADLIELVKLIKTGQDPANLSATRFSGKAETALAGRE